MILLDILLPDRSGIDVLKQIIGKAKKRADSNHYYQRRAFHRGSEVCLFAGCYGLYTEAGGH
ncbi:hypothetical protein ACFTAO_28735 [Paenibacillus rhizoplanae]